MSAIQSTDIRTTIHTFSSRWYCLQAKRMLPSEYLQMVFCLHCIVGLLDCVFSCEGVWTSKLHALYATVSITKHSIRVAYIAYIVNSGSPPFGANGALPRLLFGSEKVFKKIAQKTVCKRLTIHRRSFTTEKAYWQFIFPRLLVDIGSLLLLSPIPAFFRFCASIAC